MAERMTVEQMRDLVSYDRATGKLIWKVRLPYSRAQAGSVVGTVSMHGYREFRAYNKMYKAHRVAWALENGVWPENDIDHINGDRTDNRIENLRPATRQQNTRNRKISARNKSGFKGVSWNAHSKKWMAFFSLDGKRKFLGRFDVPEDAHAVYRDAVNAHYGDFANTGIAS